MSEDFSCIKQVDKTVQLALPINFVSNEKTGVVEILDSWKRQYSHQLEGILVNFKNVKLISSENMVVLDKFCVQVCIKASFDLFCPAIGNIVKGKINRISKEHIGCLVHDTINVVIKLTEYCPDELHKFIRLEQEILFEVEHFYCQRKEIRMKGKFTPHCLQLMSELFPVVEETITNFSFQSPNTITRYDVSDMDLNHVMLMEKDIKQEKLSSSDMSDSSPKKEKSNVDFNLFKSPENKAAKKSPDNKTNDILNVQLDTLVPGPTKATKKRKRENSESEFLANTVIKLEHDPVDPTQSTERKKSKKRKVDDLLTTENHVKKKKRKKDKGEKDKSKSGKINKAKSKKKGKTVASGEVLKKDKKKKHKNKHLKKEKKDKGKTEPKIAKKNHSKKKKSKHKNDEQIKSEY